MKIHLELGIFMDFHLFQVRLQTSCHPSNLDPALGNDAEPRRYMRNSLCEWLPTPMPSGFERVWASWGAC